MCLKVGDRVVVKREVTNAYFAGFWVHKYYGNIKGIINYFDKSLVAINTEKKLPFYSFEDFNDVYRTIILCA